MSETLGCGHPDKNRACGDCLDEAEAEVQRLELQNEGLQKVNDRLQIDFIEQRKKTEAANRLKDELIGGMATILRALFKVPSDSPSGPLAMSLAGIVNFELKKAGAMTDEMPTEKRICESTTGTNDQVRCVKGFAHGGRHSDGNLIEWYP